LTCLELYEETMSGEILDQATKDFREFDLGGFDYGLCKRNKFLATHGRKKLPKATKTGTTICGLVFDGGVVLAADTRSTAGPVVANKNCEKIHYVAPNIYACGAGTAADTDQETALISSQLNLLRLNTGRQSRVVCALTRFKRHLFRYQGHIGAYLVLGGCDSTGAHLHTIWAHGSTDTLPYVSMGSGSLASMAVLEASYKNGLTEKEGIDLVEAAIKSGIDNDLGSGSNVDIVVIRPNSTTMHRNYFKTIIPERKEKAITFPQGTTPFKRSKFTPHNAAGADDEKYDPGQGMDVDS